MLRAGLAALCALALRAAAQGVQNVTVALRDSSWKQTGVWTNEVVTACNNQPLQHCDAVDCGFSFDFTGTAVSLQATFDTDRGVIEITLDGDSQGAFQEWTDVEGESTCGVLFEKGGLTNTQHTLVATVVGTHDSSAKFEPVTITYTVPDGGSGGSSGSQAPSSGTPTNTAINAAKTAEILVNDPRIQWSADWVASSSNPSVSACQTGTRVASKVGASFSFPFQGSAVQLKTVNSPSSGAYNIVLDSQFSEAQNGYNAAASSCNPQVAWTRPNLADTNHVVTVTITGSTGNPSGGSRLEVAGFLIFGSNVVGTTAYLASQSPPSNNQAAAIGGGVGGGVGGLLLIGLGVFFYLRHRRNNAGKLNRKEDIGRPTPAMAFNPQYSAAPTAQTGWSSASPPPPTVSTATPHPHHQMINGPMYPQPTGFNNQGQGNPEYDTSLLYQNALTQNAPQQPYTPHMPPQHLPPQSISPDRHLAQQQPELMATPYHLPPPQPTSPGPSSAVESPTELPSASDAPPAYAGGNVVLPPEKSRR